MITKLKLLSDSKTITTNGLQDNHYVYPFFNFRLNKDGRLESPPLPQISCAMIDSATQINGQYMPVSFQELVNFAYHSNSELSLQYNQFYGNSKNLMDILIDCEKNSTEVPVIAYLKGWFWVGFEEDLRYYSAKFSSEWNAE